MSIIRETSLPLASIILDSNVIVEVRYTSAFQEGIPVVIKDGIISVPPFLKRGFIFEVKGVLKNTTKEQIEKNIRVPEEGWRRSFSQHVEFHANGPSKSFGIKRYDTKVATMQDAGILFLRKFQDSYELIARGAFESRESKKMIEKMIGN